MLRKGKSTARYGKFNKLIKREYFSIVIHKGKELKK